MKYSSTVAAGCKASKQVVCFFLSRGRGRLLTGRGRQDGEEVPWPRVSGRGQVRGSAG